MKPTNDITGLFKKLGENPEQYQEIVREDSARKSRDRWPLLTAIQANEPGPPPVGLRSGSRELPRELPREPVREQHREPAREAYHAPAREAWREPPWEPAREPSRDLPRDTAPDMPRRAPDQYLASSVESSALRSLSGGAERERERDRDREAPRGSSMFPRAAEERRPPDNQLSSLFNRLAAPSVTEEPVKKSKPSIFERLLR